MRWIVIAAVLAGARTVSADCGRPEAALRSWDDALSFAGCIEDNSVPTVTRADEVAPMVEAMMRGLAPTILIDLDALQHGSGRIQLRAAYQVALAHVALITRARRAIGGDPALRDVLEPELERARQTAWIAAIVIERAIEREPTLASDEVGRNIARVAHVLAIQLDGQWSSEARSASSSRSGYAGGRISSTDACATAAGSSIAMRATFGCSAAR
jgi:hypothetical protein